MVVRYWPKRMFGADGVSTDLRDQIVVVVGRAGGAFLLLSLIFLDFSDLYR